MSTLIINGSPRRNGNTRYVLSKINNELTKKGEHVEFVDISSLKLKPCLDCDACHKTDGCILPDDTKKIVNKILNADKLIIGSPVYWWGITGQLKILIDKLYSKGDELAESPKVLSMVVVGGDSLENIQYRLIENQFRSIADYLNWKFNQYQAFSASEPNELAENPDAERIINNLISKL